MIQVKRGMVEMYMVDVVMKLERGRELGRGVLDDERENVRGFGGDGYQMQLRIQSQDIVQR